MVFDEKRLSNMLSHWYTQAVGESVKDHICLYLQEELQSIPALNGVQFGISSFGNLFENFNVPHTYLVTNIENDDFALCSDGIELPFADSTQDCVILVHGFDVASDSHQLLREADRILTESGYLLIIGFNQFSLWGMLRPLMKLMKQMPWLSHFYSKNKLADWLHLLNYETKSYYSFGYLPPINNQRIIKKLRFVERLGHWLMPNWGNTYILLARKHSVPLTLNPVNAKKRYNIVGPNLIKPTA